jgi:hypothetical protein
LSTPRSPVESSIERLVGSLAGIVSVRAVCAPAGAIEEIHVIASDALHPKQVVRNVESALRAGLGLQVDRRVISIAQLEAHAGANGGSIGTLTLVPPPEDAPAPAEAAAAVAPRPGSDGGRFRFVGYDSQMQAGRGALCRVTLQGKAGEFQGEGTGAATPLGRAEAGARALFAALGAALGSATGGALALAGVELVSTHGQTYVLVAAHARAGRERVSLTGLAPLQRSPEEAAILAALQASNRWATHTS